MLRGKRSKNEINTPRRIVTTNIRFLRPLSVYKIIMPYTAALYQNGSSTCSHTHTHRSRTRVVLNHLSSVFKHRAPNHFGRASVRVLRLHVREAAIINTSAVLYLFFLDVY